MVMDKKIGFIGLGVMGAAFATRLINSGYTPIVYDVVPGLVEKLTELGAMAASSPKELAQSCDVVMMSLPNPAIVTNVFQGKDGIVSGAKPGTVVIDFSTIDPDTTRKNNKVALEIGISLLDAPVSGGAPQILVGMLTIMVGGDEEVFNNHLPLLELFGKSVYYVGESGCGNVVKLTNNMISLGNNMIAAESLVFGVKAGVKPDVLYNILCNSACRSFHLLNLFPALFQRKFEPGFKIDLGKKDLGLALDMAKSINSPLLVTSTVNQLMTAASAAGHGDEDCLAVAKLFEEWAGVQVEGEGKKSSVVI